MLEASSRIDVIDWKLIGSCNLRCLHCYGPPKTERSLPLFQLQEITERFSELSPSWIVLTGGEPLLVQGISTVMEDLRDIGAKIALSTNTSFFRKYQGVIEEHVSSLNIPIDGSTPRIHALSRRDETSYHTAFDVLEHYATTPTIKPELLRVGSVYSQATKGDFLALAERLEPYADVIDRWKIYELMDYEVQPDKRKSLLHNPNDFVTETALLVETLAERESPLTEKVMVASNQSRDKAYFMVNPQGLVVMPTEKAGVTYEMPLGHILRDDLAELVDRWGTAIEGSCYYDNHRHYEQTAETVL